MPHFIPPTLGELSWRTARRCDVGNCVRVAASTGVIVIGDTKDPDGSVLFKSHPEWLAFVDGVRRGDFDHLT